MKLSVIIPCFNAATTIGSQLEALANQQWSEPWEVIVADNGSTDQSMAVIESYRHRLPALRIVEVSDQSGSFHARNMGALAANGEALAFCDADDRVGDGWVSAMGDALSQYDFVAGIMDLTELNESWVLQTRPELRQQQQGLLKYNFFPYAGSNNLGVKRELHQSIGGFDSSLKNLGDIDYCWRLQLAGVELHCEPKAIVHYRLRHSLKGLYNQSRKYGQAFVFLSKRYQSKGLPVPSWKASLKMGLKAWGELLKDLPSKASNKGDFAEWLWRLGRRIGRLQGSIKHQILIL